MNSNLEIAARFKEVFLDGKWVVSTNYKTLLSDVTWEHATTRIGTLNTIAELTFHVNYYISGILDVFKNGKLEIKDKFSFDMEPIKSKKDWDNLLNQMWCDVSKLSEHLEEISHEKLEEVLIILNLEKG